METMISMKNVSKNYGDYKLKNMNLEIPGGCIMGLIGENGAGKSTTIKMILDIVHMDSGSISIMGKSSKNLPVDIKEQIGVVMDECCFFDMFTCKDVSSMMAGMYKSWDKNCFYNYLKRLSVPENKKMKDCSRGTRMKISIAAALSHNSKLLILDEATSGLDPVVRDEILDLFYSFVEDEDHSILISSHILSDLEKVCDYIAFLQKGRLVFCQEKDEMLGKYGILKCSSEQLARLPASAVIGARQNSFGVEALVLKSAVPGGMIVDPASIEEIMLYHERGKIA